MPVHTISFGHIVYVMSHSTKNFLKHFAYVLFWPQNPFQGADIRCPLMRFL